MLQALVTKYGHDFTYFISKGPSNQSLRTLVPKTINEVMVLGARDLSEHWILEPSGTFCMFSLGTLGPR